MDKLLKRFALPNYIKLPYKFNSNKLEEALKIVPKNESDDLTSRESYGEKVGARSEKLQKAFGLQFNSFEDAYKFLQENDVDESELRNGLPENRRMAWDFRNYVKPFENYIKETPNGKFKVTGSPYKQIALTEFNEKIQKRIYDVKIPRTRLDERHYNKLKPWVKGTYFEKVLNCFKGEVHRARLAIMEPGAYVTEHIDYNTDYSIRFHIPIITNQQCGFYVRNRDRSKEHLFMPANGEAWFLNQGKPHCAWNKGNTQRCHLIISVSGQQDITGLI